MTLSYDIVPARRAELPLLAAHARAWVIDAYGYEGSTGAALSIHLEQNCSPAYFERSFAESVILTARARRGTAEHWLGYAKLGGVTADIAAEPGDRQLNRLYIHPSYRGRGIGAALLEAILRDAAAQQPSRQSRRILLDVWDQNRGAIRFYRAHGFTVVGEQIYRMGSQSDRELILMRAV